MKKLKTEKLRVNKETLRLMESNVEELKAVLGGYSAGCSMFPGGPSCLPCETY